MHHRLPCVIGAAYLVPGSAAGSPKFSAFLSACQALRTPTDPPASRPADAAGVGFRCVQTVAVCLLAFTRLYQTSRCAVTFRPPEFPVDTSPVLFARSPDSTTGATRGMGGCLDLTRWGLPPQETPSFAWRTNASLQLLPKAPGSQGMLPYPSPRRTVHESRPHGASPGCLLSMSLVVCVMTPPMPKPAVLLAIVTALVWGWFSALSGIACLWCTRDVSHVSQAARRGLEH